MASEKLYRNTLRKINAKYLELLRKGSAHKFYCLIVLITLEQLNTSDQGSKKEES